MQQYVVGKQTVYLLLKSSYKVEKLFLLENLNPLTFKIFSELAKDQSIKVEIIKNRKILDQMVPHMLHQGIVAVFVQSIAYVKLDFFKDKKRILILDHLEDSRNVGAILRSAEQFQVDGIIFPKDRSFKIDMNLMKTSTGAIFLVHLCPVVNLARAVDQLKELGIWVFGLHKGKASQSINRIQWPEKIALVVGNEGTGLGTLMKKKVDQLIEIPTYGHGQSLNVSVATGIALSRILSVNEY